MTSKEIFDVLCLKNEIVFTKKISDYCHANVDIRQTNTGWLVRQLYESNPHYNHQHFLFTDKLMKYIKDNRAAIQKALQGGY
jgi:hypothetical protein